MTMRNVLRGSTWSAGSLLIRDELRLKNANTLMLYLKLLIAIDFFYIKSRVEH